MQLSYRERLCSFSEFIENTFCVEGLDLVSLSLALVRSSHQGVDARVGAEKRASSPLNVLSIECVLYRTCSHQGVDGRVGAEKRASQCVAAPPPTQPPAPPTKKKKIKIKIIPRRAASKITSCSAT